MKTNDPIDEQITNDDSSVTNKDGDNMLEKGEQPTEQTKPDDERVPTVTPEPPGPLKGETKSTEKPHL